VRSRKNLARATINDFSIWVLDRAFDTKLKIVAKSFLLEDLLGYGDDAYFLLGGDQKNRRPGGEVSTQLPVLTMEFADVSAFVSLSQRNVS